MNNNRTQAIWAQGRADVSGRAIFSACGLYRYTLERSWASLPRYVLWLMLNPSTADAEKNDATIRRCLGYARAWGYTGILVGNLYAWRSTSPAGLLAAAAKGADIIGPENDRYVRGLVRRSSLVVCAWGRSGPLTAAKFQVMQLFRPPREIGVPDLHLLRMNANQEPAHPLRLPKSLEPVRWDYFRNAGNGAGG